MSGMLRHRYAHPSTGSCPDPSIWRECVHHPHGVWRHVTSIIMRIGLSRGHTRRTTSLLGHRLACMDCKDKCDIKERETENEEDKSRTRHNMPPRRSIRGACQDLSKLPASEAPDVFEYPRNGPRRAGRNARNSLARCMERTCALSVRIPDHPYSWPRYQARRQGAASGLTGGAVSRFPSTLMTWMVLGTCWPERHTKVSQSGIDPCSNGILLLQRFASLCRRVSTRLLMRWELKLGWLENWKGIDEVTLDTRRAYAPDGIYLPSEEWLQSLSDATARVFKTLAPPATWGGGARSLEPSTRNFWPWCISLIYQLAIMDMGDASHWSKLCKYPSPELLTRPVL